MKPGRELDTLIAEKVMDIAVYPGYKIVGPTSKLDGTEIGELNTDLPHYSTDIAAAWPIAEMFRMVIRPTVVNNWSAGVFKSVTLEPDGGSVKCVPGTWVEAETTPFAICLCALKAIEILA